MIKKQYHHLAITVLLFAIAIGFNYYIRIAPQTKNHAAKINLHLHQLEGEVNKFFDQRDFLLRQLEGVNSEKEDISHQDFNSILNLSEQLYTIAVFQNDSLLFWTNNQAIPSPSEIAETTNTRSSKFIERKNGFYELISQRYRDPAVGEFVVCALIPIKFNYNLESAYLKNEFVASNSIPQDYKLTTIENSFPIVTESGETLCYLSHGANLISSAQMQIGLWLYLLAFLSLAVFFNNVSKYLIKNNHPWQGAAFLIVSIFWRSFDYYIF